MCTPDATRRCRVTFQICDERRVSEGVGCAVYVYFAARREYTAAERNRGAHDAQPVVPKGVLASSRTKFDKEQGANVIAGA